MRILHPPLLHRAGGRLPTASSRSQRLRLNPLLARFPIAACALLALAACGQGVAEKPRAAPRVASLDASFATKDATPPPGFSRRERLRVRHVHDGDTIIVGEDERVRILGIDTPELDAENAIARSLAQAAGQETERLVLGRDVTLLVGLPATDKFGRTLAYVELVDEAGEADIGARLVSNGFAQLYPASHPRQDDYRRREREARLAERGLWAPEGQEALGLKVEGSVDAAEALAHVGHRMRVTGSVHRINLVAPGLFIDFGPARADFSAIIFRNALPSFPDDARKQWLHQRLAVTGVIREHEGTPEIILESPDQVEILRD